jgi:hypothetical protein
MMAGCWWTRCPAGEACSSELKRVGGELRAWWALLASLSVAGVELAGILQVSCMRRSI